MTAFSAIMKPYAFFLFFPNISKYYYSWFKETLLFDDHINCCSRLQQNRIIYMANYMEFKISIIYKCQLYIDITTELSMCLHIDHELLKLFVN